MFIRLNGVIMFQKIMNIFLSLLLAGCLGFYLPGTEEAEATHIKADKIVVIKSKRIMMLLREGEILKAYRIALGKEPVGHKMNEGDMRTPEGIYRVDSRNSDSRFHRSLHISYPSQSDILNAQKLGLSPGGDIMIHGLPDRLKNIGELHRFSDWTEGCIAVTNTEIEEIWQMVPDGIPIEINP